MNMKDMEALVVAQGALIEELQSRIQIDPIPALGEAVEALTAKHQAQLEAHMHLIQRTDNIVEGFKKELAGRDERIEQLSIAFDAARRELTAVHEQNSEMQGLLDGMNDTLFGAVGRIEKLETMVLARNSSAPTKRNMTDEDALRVLTGDLRELAHKDAAEKAGLTYAQVYSCRLEFTFKHVHKTLRDGSTPEAPWVNAWVK